MAQLGAWWVELLIATQSLNKPRQMDCPLDFYFKSDGLPLDFLIQKIQILVVIHLSYIGSPLKARPIRRLARLWKKLHLSFTEKSAKIRARPELFRTFLKGVRGAPPPPTGRGGDRRRARARAKYTGFFFKAKL